MATERLTEPAAIDHLLGEIVDTREKLDVLVFLHRLGVGTCTTHAIAAAVKHPSVPVAEALSALTHAGIVATSNDDGAGWWLDPYSGWGRAIGTVAQIYEHDRIGLLHRITSLALRRIRGESGGGLVNVVVMHPKHEP